MTSSGLETTMTIDFGATRAMFSATDFTMPALVRTRSSRLMPGFRAMPAVTTKTSASFASSYPCPPTQRTSNPSIGADCHWSSAFPCGPPSATSIITTVRARCFSARRCAAVAPTFPAPTTATLFSIIVRLAGSRMKLRERLASRGETYKEPLRSTTLQTSQPFIHNDTHGVGQIEAPHRPIHGNPEALLGVLFENPRRHSIHLIAEDAHGVVPEWRLAIVALGIRREVEATLA